MIGKSTAGRHSIECRPIYTQPVHRLTTKVLPNSGGKLTQDVLKDAAVLEIFQFVERIDPAN